MRTRNLRPGCQYRPGSPFAVPTVCPEAGRADAGLLRTGELARRSAEATLELMNPGRAFLGVGTGEALNEVPAGLDWPPPAEQLARAEEALTIITRMLDGETVTFDGRFFRAHGARLYDRPQRRVPVYMSAFGPPPPRSRAGWRTGCGRWPTR